MLRPALSYPALFSHWLPTCWQLRLSLLAWNWEELLWGIWPVQEAYFQGNEMDRGLGGAGDFQMTIHIRTRFIGHTTGFEVKRLFACVQFGASCISMFSCFYIFKEPGPCVFASSSRFHEEWGWGQPSLEQEGTWGMMVALGIQNRRANFDLEAT